MPPLNHRSDLERSGTVYQVKVQERDPESESHHTRDTHFTETLSAALTAASAVVPGDTHGYRRMSLGTIFIWEQHDDGEPHTRAAIRERRVYDE
jgi:hypothetical protein